MIRPFTLVCMASAFGAGLYLYQSKHAAQVLDREITRTLKQTEGTRERTGMLRAEWALLNEPDRLAELARAHLTLQTLRPTQFAAMADLGARLPAPVATRPETLPAETEEAVPVAQAAPAAAAAKPREVAVAEARSADTRPADTKPADVKPGDAKLADAKPRAEKPAAESKPARVPEKPVLARAEPHGTEPAVAAGSLAAPIRPHAPAVAASPVATAEATAPGTVGAAVLRAMRAQGSAYGQAAPVAAPAPRSYVPAYVQPASNAPSYAQPAYASPAYAAPSYATPSYATPGYAPPAASVLGGRPALPPPVPFAAR